MWWVFLDPRFEPYGAFAALGVGNQMIAVFPKLDMVIVNRADTYVGEGTPPPALMDLMAQVIEARTGVASAAADLEPLEVLADPGVTSVAGDRLTEYVGEWDYPAPPLGLPARTHVDITAGEGHLVGHSPVSGTFALYLQEDGSFHEEDSHERYVAIRDADGAFAGLAGPRAVVTAAIAAARDGRGDRAEALLAEVAGDTSIEVEVGRAIVDLIGGQREAADSRIRDLAAENDPARVEADVNAEGYLLLQADAVAQAVELFELNTRVFPEAFNAWDSLGEGHMLLGNDEEAIQSYQRSLELNPDNANAEDMIAQIRAGEE
jgi:tetratricopeptide (TPR) repeat protein